MERWKIAMPEARRKVGEGKEACKGLVLDMILTVDTGAGVVDG